MAGLRVAINLKHKNQLDTSKLGIHEQSAPRKWHGSTPHYSVFQAIHLGSFLLAILNGLSGIAIRFQFRGRRAPGSKPDSPEDPPCLMSPRWCDVEPWRGYQLRCRPCHLTTVQNDNVRPKSPRVSSELDVNVTKLNFRHFNLDEFIIGP
ncbi:hypothetical protein AVEN_122706-1 [Araneus ventricosus]|uniref:Uncharacterized protein n=2 Tax=Araneus ventricosus TaxID=182803 RepID=A0A4Y2HYW0_ARAVE|nr:hypothetical protein AVEN_122706-1 [Araneus ventricosus]